MCLPRRRPPCPAPAPAAPRLSAGAGGHLPPLRPFPLGRAGGSDPRFSESRETSHPERWLSSGSPAVCPGSGPAAAPRGSAGGAEPRCLLSLRARRRCRRGGEPLPATGDSRPVPGDVRTGASRKESASWLQGRLLSSPLCFQVSASPSSAREAEKVPVSFAKNAAPAASRPGGAAEHRSGLPAGGDRAGTRRGSLWSVGWSCSPAPASRNAACARMDHWTFAFLYRVLLHFEKGAVPAGPERRGGGASLPCLAAHL